MSGKECLGHLQLFEKTEGFGLAVLFHKKVGHREGRGIPALSSFVAATWGQPQITVPMQMLLPEPGLGHIQCWLTAEFFLYKEPFLKGHKSFQKWGKRPKLCLSGSEKGGELSGSGLGCIWNLAKLYLGWSPARAPWFSGASTMWAGSALAHQDRWIAAKGQ